jgi:hypothetical protein
VNRTIAVALVLSIAACRKPATSTTEAGAEAKPSAASSASIATDEEEDDGLDAGAASTCPRPLHPDYCRHNCRGLASRAQTKHARRVDPSERIAFGKCGDMDVFAEDQYIGDGGLKSGIVEYFNDAGTLVGATDTRVKPCGQFGTVPSCTPTLAWEDSRTFTLHIDPIEATQLPPEVISRILRQNFGRFKLCALDAKGPRVTGRVVAKVAIAKDGSVTSAKDDGSDVADKKITTCVIGAMQHMTFPEPQGGAMTVRVPLVFRH